tara:strand:- start:220 stop:453 length:234 start_codon:yes stop_codon:yes gene_type:complete
MRWLVPASPTKNSFKGQVSHHLERNWLRSYEVEWFMINLQALRLCGHNQVVYLPEVLVLWLLFWTVEGGGEAVRLGY